MWKKIKLLIIGVMLLVSSNGCWWRGDHGGPGDGGHDEHHDEHHEEHHEDQGGDEHH